VFVLAATAAEDEAAEIPELGHGILTYTLLAGLDAVDDGPLDGKAIVPNSPDRIVDVLEWFNYAGGRVPDLTQQFVGRTQDIQLSGEGTGFPLLPISDIAVHR
jgi:hypothetical protein